MIVPMEQLLDRIIQDFNHNYAGHHSLVTKVKKLNSTEALIPLTCTISGFVENSYGKFPKDGNQILMEFNPFSAYLLDFLPKELSEDTYFRKYMLGELADQNSQTD